MKPKLIPLNDPYRFVSLNRRQIRLCIDRVIKSGHYILGPENEALEEELKEFFRFPDVALVGNGTDAIEIALKALEVSPGDKVVTTANAGGYATTAILGLGAQPLYVDVEADSLQMDPRSLESTLSQRSEKVTAIVVTHLFGRAAPIEELVRVATRFSIPVVEDCAQSLGVKKGNRWLGSFGAIATTSFYPTKNLGGLGDGGAVLSRDKRLVGKAKALRQYGWSEKYKSDLKQGQNSRLDEFQAAVIRFRLTKLREANAARRIIHEEYERIGNPVCLPVNSINQPFEPHLAVFRTSSRNEASRFFSSRGISTGIHYPIPDHEQRGFWQGNEDRPRLPITEESVKQILTLPLFPELSNQEIERICSALGDFERRQ